MTFTPAPGKAKGYHPISLLSFMQKKKMQKLVARHIREVTELCPLQLYLSVYKLDKPTETAMHHVYTYKGNSGKIGKLL